jgi:hypothetical protein
LGGGQDAGEEEAGLEEEAEGVGKRQRWSEAHDSGDELAARLSVPELVAVYEQAERDIRDAYAMVLRAEERLRLAFKTSYVSVSDNYDRVRWDNPDDSLENVQRRLWGALVDGLEIRRFMSISAAEKLDRQLREDKMPPLTIANVLAMAQGFRQNLDEMLEESVADVFRRLTPQNDWKRLKTNSKFEVGRKVIMSGMIERDWSGWGLRWGQYSSAEAELRALENVFTALDGKGSITKAHYSAISMAIKAAPKAETCEGETPYFKFRGFRNGNLHITFLRPDLLARFNAIAGGRNLKPRAE